MLSPNLGPWEKIHKDPRQADNNHKHKANAIIIIVFLIEITGTMNNQDRQDSTKSRTKCILLTTLPLHLHLSAGSDLLSRSIMQLAEMQSRSLELFAAQQKSQIDVYQELTRSNKEKEHNALFTLIPVFDGDRTQCEQWLDGHGPSYQN